MAPGSQKGLQVVFDDVQAVREHLVSRNAEASEVDVQPWGSVIDFSDPDGTTWSVQQPHAGNPTPPHRSGKLPGAPDGCGEGGEALGDVPSAG
jgi:hypothetical protein